MSKLPLRALVFICLISTVTVAEDNPSTSRPTLAIDLSQPIAPPVTGHLKVGGKNPAGVEIAANSRYLTLGGKPWLPVMGEFHYTRYPQDQWETELLKMKAGGITIVSTYVFWIHHEEVEGQFDWTGDRDLRTFVQLCGKHGLLAWVRLGPWCHGEVRNGGLPDWVLAKCGKNIRKEDPQFMGYVRTLYEQIARQISGQLWKDGGPVIGVQLDNEMPNNPNYLLALKRLAQDVGIDVPIYSVTGWNGVRFPADEVIPLFGGYADGFWEGGKTFSKQDRKQFFFNHTRDDSSIGADLMPGKGRQALASEHDRYPFVTCECGGGMETSYIRRPTMSASDVAVLSMVKIGDGSNLPGYYMYHGGRNPQGKLSTLQESQASNYPNDMPVIRYDFQAALGQYGQVRESYDALRIIHTFLADFGPELATMPSFLPAEQPKSLDDTQTLRWAVRSDGHRGFIFVNNYQRGDALPERKDVQLTLKLADGEHKVPAEPTTIAAGAYAIWPFNLDMNGVLLRYATAQLLCRIDIAGTPCYVFFAPAGVKSEFGFDSKSIAAFSALTGAGQAGDTTIIRDIEPGTKSLQTTGTAEEPKVRFLLLTQEQAMHAYVTDFAGARRLILSPDGNLIVDGDSLRVQSTKPTASVAIFPRTKQLMGPTGSPLGATTDGAFVRYQAVSAPQSIALETRQVKPAGPAREIKIGSRRKPLPPGDADFTDAAEWHVTMPKDLLDGSREVLLRVDYTGDVARAYVGDRLIDDNFCFGQPWELSLKRFAPEVLEKGVTIKVLPLRKDLPVYMAEDHRPTFDDKGEALEMRGIEAVPVYELSFAAGQKSGN